MKAYAKTVQTLYKSNWAHLQPLWPPVIPRSTDCTQEKSRTLPMEPSAINGVWIWATNFQNNVFCKTKVFSDFCFRYGASSCFLKHAVPRPNSGMGPKSSVSSTDFCPDFFCMVSFLCVEVCAGEVVFPEGLPKFFSLLLCPVTLVI